MSLKYNPFTAYKYQTRLTNIKQRNFYTIRAYAKEVRITVNELGFCHLWNDDTIRANIEKTFFAGLDDIVKFEITKFARSDFQSICEALIRMKNFWSKELTAYQTQIVYISEENHRNARTIIAKKIHNEESNQ